MNTIPNMSDPPFACPPDIVLDLPIAPAINRTRKINWRAHKRTTAWHKHCDGLLMASAYYREVKKRPIKGQFEVTLILDEQRTDVDLDAVVKSTIDFLRRIELIVDDGQKYMRRVVLEWGRAPEGCRVVLKEIG